jgi:hypothetical protein
MFQNTLVSFIILSFFYFTIFIPSKELIEKHTKNVLSYEFKYEKPLTIGWHISKNDHHQLTTNSDSDIEQTSVIDTSEFQYQDWKIDSFKELVLYGADAQGFKGHIFGWVKKAGSCDQDDLFISFSTTHESKAMLDKLVNQRISMIVTFPEAEGVSYVMEPKIISTKNSDETKHIILARVPKDPVFDLYMHKLHMLEIGIQKPYQQMFDMHYDSWSLDGYVAAKLKAKEMCDLITQNQNLI